VLVLLLHRSGVLTAIPHRPLLAPWYRLVGDGDRLLLEHGQVVVVLEGGAVSSLLPVLLPLLDGTRTADELVDRVGVAARPAVELALDVLARHDLLVEGPPAPEPRAAAHALAAEFALAPALARDRLTTAAVAVVGTSPAAAEVARLLRLAGVADVRRASWRRRVDVAVAVVAPAADEVDRLQPWNALALEHDVVWLPVRPFDGRFAAVGPLVVPRESACYECVLLRRGANLAYGADLADVEAAPVAATADPAVESIAAAVAAHLVLRWVVGRDTSVPGVMHAVETRPRLALADHAVLRVPRCPACSTAGAVAPPLPWHEADAA
jgi:bacteriocin biosynthesis cyclodehydratase domain-containing protein